MAEATPSTLRADQAPEAIVSERDAGGAVVVEVPEPAGTPAVDKAPAAAAPEKKPAAGDSADVGIEDLKRQLAEATAKTKTDEAARKEAEQRRDEAYRSAEAERQARTAAEQRVQTHRTEATQFRTAAQQAQYDSIAGALTTAESARDALKSALSGAYKEGDFDKIADIQSRMGEVSADISHLKNGKAALEAERKAAAEAPPQPDRSANPREDFIRQQPTRTAAWLRAHDRFFTDQRYQDLVVGASRLALGKGIAHESEDYFRFIEEQAGDRQAEAPRQEAPAAAQAQQAPPRQPAAAAPPAAPPSRTTPDGTPSSRTTTVTLTPEEAAIAPTLFPKMKDTDPEPTIAYAQWKLQCIRDGSLNRVMGRS